MALAIAENTTLEHLDLSETDQNKTSLTYFITVLRTDQQPFNKTLKILNLSRPIPDFLYSKIKSRHLAEITGSMLKVTIDAIV